MDGNAGHGEGMRPQREAPAEIEVVELKSRSDVQTALGEIGGSNLLNERGILEKMMSQPSEWLDTVESEVINKRGAALAFKQDGKTIGFILADPEGVVTQFRSLDGTEKDVLERGLQRLKDKGFEHIDVRLTERSEHMRHVLHDAGFEGEERTQDGKVTMKKE